MIYVDGFGIDASITEEHTSEAEITSFPIESGGQITDHRQKMPRTVTMDIVVSDTPLGDAARLRELEAATGLTVGLPSEEAWAFFKRLHEEGRLVEVATNLEFYPQALLESITTTDDSETGDTFTASVTFREVIIVENRRTFVDVALPRGAKSRDLGSRGAKIVGGVDVDPHSGRNIAYIVPGPGQEGRFWYVSDGGVPIRELSQEELDDMNGALEDEAAIEDGPKRYNSPYYVNGKPITTQPYIGSDRKSWWDAAPRPKALR